MKSTAAHTPKALRSSWCGSEAAIPLRSTDFVPGHEPYEHLTTIDIEAAGDRTNVVMTVDPLHDETWTQQHRAHRGDELDNLEAAIRRHTM
ncbi:hypothetical protein [Nonomuraea sp. CA-141351]|uniref:hypothetical protein n=1 Tax=Nonomuraea sp. CA-141351 TaxID=3239996 RepID=UPI003D9220EC